MIQQNSYGLFEASPQNNLKTTSHTHTLSLPDGPDLLLANLAHPALAV